MKFLIILMVFTMTGSAFANFSNKVNGEYVTVSGKISDSKPNTFMLNTNDKKILVEMDDYNSWVADGLKLNNGDNVVVSGRVDQDLFEKKKIEAGSVYVKNSNTYYFANSDDEEDLYFRTPAFSIIGPLKEGTLIDLQGKITSVSGREMTVDTGLRKIKVDTKDMIYNPLDNTGFTKLEVGDRVRVSGQIQDDLFDTKEVSASYVNELPKKI